MRYLKLCILFFVVLPILVTCTHKPTEPESITPIVSELTVVLTEQDLTGANVTEDQITLIGEPSSQLVAGNIIVAAPVDGIPHGLLRKITNVTKTKSGYDLTTTNARLEDVFDQGTIAFDGDLLTTDLADSLSKGLGDGVELVVDKANPFLFTFNINKFQVFDSGTYVAVTGQITVSLRFEFDLDITLLQGLKKCGFKMVVTGSGNLEIASNAGFGWEDDFTLAEYEFKERTFFVGIIPVVYQPVISLKLGMAASAQAETTVSSSYDVSYTAGVEYKKSGGLSAISSLSKTFHPSVSVTDAGAMIEASVGPNLELSFYDSGGPYVNPQSYLRYEANLNAVPWWKLIGGFRAVGGIGFEVLGYEVDVSMEIFDKHFTIAEAPPNTCNPPQFNYGGGTYTYPLQIIMTCSTEGSTIRYTTNGSEPSSSSTAYTSPVLLEEDAVIRAKSYKSGLDPSKTVSVTYYFMGEQFDEITSFDTDGIASDVAYLGTIIYVANDYAGLAVFEVTDPINFGTAVLGNYPVPGNNPARKVIVAGNYLYVGISNFGVKIFDCSTPNSLIEKGVCYANDFGFVVSDNYVYLVDSVTGLKVFDVSNPLNPSFIGSYALPQSAERRIAKSGNYVYITGRTSGLHVINVSDRSNPVLEGTYSMPNGNSAIAVSGDYAYITNINYALYIVNVHLPSAMSLTGYCAGLNSPVDIKVVPGYAFIADGADGLQVIRTGNPYLPTITQNNYDTPGTAKGVTVCGNFVFIADGNQGVCIVNISDFTK